MAQVVKESSKWSLENSPNYWSGIFPHDLWMKAQGIPIHTGYYIPDMRTAELAWWEERKCNAAFIQLMGQEGVSEARISEIPPGETLPPLNFALDEIVYVVSGRGLTTTWSGNGPKKTFEWQTHSMFLIPHHTTHQFSNMQGDKPVRLLHYNYFPIALSAIQDPNFFFNNDSYANLSLYDEGDFYSEAKVVQESGGRIRGGRTVNFWYGNFFPDMKAWDRLDELKERGAGGHAVFIQFPRSQTSCHMSVFPARTYKKAHRHGPGRVIVIPAGDGYSIMWQEGKEKVVVPWTESALFVPPEKWFHQHFNTGKADARYLAFHPLSQFAGYAEKVEDRARDQLEYHQEDPWIREKFEEELAKKGIKSDMPDQVYKDPNFQWKY